MAAGGKARQKKKPGWLNKKEMAASIGISVQAFDKWNVEPIAKIGRETFYIVEDVLDNRLEHERKKSEGMRNLAGKSLQEMLDDPNTDVFQYGELQKIEKVRLENERTRLQIAVLEGKSLPAWAVREVLARILAQVGEILDGLPLKIKRKYPKIDKPVVEMIKGAIVSAQNEAARVGEYTEEIIDDVVAEAEDRIR